LDATAVRINLNGLESPAHGSIADFAARTIARVRARIAAARQAREAHALLLDMNDRELRDIGLTRFEVQRFYSDGQV
jgi:uncharacterized protein YjiS (DUF1127 family)